MNDNQSISAEDLQSAEFAVDYVRQCMGLYASKGLSLFELAAAMFIHGRGVLEATLGDRFDPTASLEELAHMFSDNASSGVNGTSH